eukprot:CAMPEP_0194228314 /NCGR_PEP_ID=MMETSP0156-20130528/43309_1 /TAXON_ID=33649 /ORGANISM="Thalassionema nitzschioides, Strain L26-B" /LENGTH=627 /DNA_ID=CAMNT_0038960825 /DNA_START=68 /DNA_END=1951 /DNA_ORIENTATION=+
MASSGWYRVAIGARKVAEAAIFRASENSYEVFDKTLQHAAELGKNLRLVATISIQNEKLGHEPNKSGRNDYTQAANASSPNDTTELSPEKLRYDERSSGRNYNAEALEPKRLMKELTQENNHEKNPDLLEQPKPIDDTVEVSHSTSVNSSSKVDEEALTFSSSTIDEKYNRLEEGKYVPSSRTSRAFGFASLGLGIAMGTLAEASSRVFRSGAPNAPRSSIIASDANADRLASTLCRMRGAALKMGQMLSIQDESLLPPALTRALNQVRQGANAMPKEQLMNQLEAQLGSNWNDRFESFDPLPFAAASIGQVHLAKIQVGNSIKDVVVKVQYPGVANSIESDLENLTMLVKMTGFAPTGLFIDNVIRVGRDELKVECDYLQEKENQQRIKLLVESDAILKQENFYVPDVFEEFTTSEVLTTEFAKGGTIDKVINMNQEERDRVGRYIFYITMQELFVWRFMQTDPNWGNFLYDVGTRRTSLIDFGAAREYPKEFVDGYLRIVWANANRDEEVLMDLSHKMGFLTGKENDIMLVAHKQSGFTLGEPFATDTPFDFKGSNISSRLSAHSAAFMQHRLTAPPEEVYTLHRKLAGAFMLCIKLGAKVRCRDLLEDIVRNHTFEDGMEPPKL